MIRSRCKLTIGERLIHFTWLVNCLFILFYVNHALIVIVKMYIAVAHFNQFCYSTALLVLSAPVFRANLLSMRHVWSFILYTYRFLFALFHPTTYKKLS